MVRFTLTKETVIIEFGLDEFVVVVLDVFVVEFLMRICCDCYVPSVCCVLLFVVIDLGSSFCCLDDSYFLYNDLAVFSIVGCFRLLAWHLLFVCYSINFVEGFPVIIVCKIFYQEI